MQQNSALFAISPIDGRYKNTTEHLQNYFSEFALIKYRVKIEIEYFIALQEVKIVSLNAKQISQLRNIYIKFNEANATEIKNIEKETNHDVKAVEYFIKNKLAKIGLTKQSEWIHFGLTSQDINNTATPMLWKDAMHQQYIPFLIELIEELREKSIAWKNIPMLAKTHGQPASPTLLGKELFVFVERLEKQLILLMNIPFAAKFGGATGNFNAHYVAFPKINWNKFAQNFVDNTLGLDRSSFTTQIEHYDMFAAQCDALKRINTILIDACRDIWTYISMEYFKQKLKKNEVGSSAMPHKVNPIDFENAEGNFGIANALFEHFSTKLPISRLQRDLTDSTVMRNIGVPVAHSYLAISSMKKGLDKLILNVEKLEDDLENNWAVVAEAIQTILRREQFPKPYEALKNLTRGNSKIDKNAIHQFIDSLEIKDAIKKELKKITPQNYVGKNLEF
ncbi:MAG: adenylosuccinate lyase [Chitinophagaceae bacterium]|nr:adenylosuccinate lyase [Chitinophagaceae bacterium]